LKTISTATFELEARWKKKKINYTMKVRRLADMANIHFIRQKKSTGLGDAIYYAAIHTGNEPFAVPASAIPLLIQSFLLPSS
jgi:UTP-glucose-1-phosphate uridylyltransferase